MSWSASSSSINRMVGSSAVFTSSPCFAQRYKVHIRFFVPSVERTKRSSSSYAGHLETSTCHSSHGANSSSKLMRNIPAIAKFSRYPSPRVTPMAPAQCPPRAGASFSLTIELTSGSTTASCQRSARPSAGRRSKSFSGRLRRCWDQPHTQLHLGRDIVGPHDVAAVAQAGCLTLHHEHPERVTGFHHQLAPCRLHRVRHLGEGMGGVELAQARERLLERAAHPSKRGGLFLNDLIMED